MKDTRAVINAKLQELGVPLYKLAEKTGIKYMKVYKSLAKDYKRPIYAEEFIKICIALNLTLADFVETGS